jgi:hypothetical protein
MRNAVDDHIVAGGNSHLHAAYMDKLGADPLNLHGIDMVDKCAGEGILHSEQDSNFLQSNLLCYR